VVSEGPQGPVRVGDAAADGLVADAVWSRFLSSSPAWVRISVAAQESADAARPASDFVAVLGESEAT